jgi:hypothetical protein
VDLFCKEIYCRRTTGIKINRHPNFFAPSVITDAFELCVGSTYHIDQIHYCSITGDAIGFANQELVTLKEFPNDLYLRSGFSE